MAGACPASTLGWLPSRASSCSGRVEPLPPKNFIVSDLKAIKELLCASWINLVLLVIPRTVP